MVGTPQIINGITICYARLAMTDGGGKWVVGTVLELYPLDWEFNWGDMARFLVIRLKLSEAQVGMVHARKLKIPLDSFMSQTSLDAHRANRTEPRMKKLDFESNGKKPKLDKEVDGMTFGIITPEKQWVEEIEEVL